MKEIKKIRSEIDKVDQKLLAALAARKELVEEAGEYKAKNNFKIRDPKREKEMLKTRQAFAKKLGISKKFTEQIFRAIILEAVRIQKEQRNAFKKNSKN